MYKLQTLPVYLSRFQTDLVRFLVWKSPSEFPLNEQPCKTNFLRLFKQFFLSRVQPLAHALAVTDWPISCRLFLNDLNLLLFIFRKKDKRKKVEEIREMIML